MAEELIKALENFSKIEKVSGAVLMAEKGKILATTLDKKGPRNNEKKIFSGFKSGEKLGELMGMGMLNHSYLEFSNFSFTAEKFKGNVVLIVVSKSGANLGRIRLEIRKSRKNLEGLLSQAA